MSQPPDHHGPSYKLPSPPPPDPTGWFELRRKARATFWPPLPVAWAGFLALAVAAAGLHGLWFLGSLPARLPSPTDWKAVAALLARDARPGDAVVLSPAWAERAREILPDRLPSWPDVALPLLALPSYAEADEDLPGVSRIWLVSLPGAPGVSPRIARQLAARSEATEGPLQVGRLDLTRYDLRSPLLPLHSFTDRLASAPIRSPGARVTRETREVDLLPRTCIVVSFPGPLPEPATLAFPAVPLGRALRGHLGFVGDVSSGAPPVSLRVKVDGLEVGRAEATAARPGWSAFQIDTARISGQPRQVTLEVVPSGPLPRGVCIDLVSLPVNLRIGIATAWAAGVLVVAAATSPAVGISRDESVYVEAGASYVRFWREALRSPGRVLELADRHYAWNHEHPGLAKGIFGATRTLLSDVLGWTGEVQGSRYGAFLFAALLALVLALWGFDLAGPLGGALAPAFFFLVPRHFHHAHAAVLDLPVSSLWLATTYAFWRSTSASRGRLSTAGWAMATGLLLGAALATKHNAFFLPLVLLGAWLLGSIRGRQREAAHHAEGGGPWAFAAMAVLGPLVLLASWPWLWHHTLPRIRDWLGYHLHHENYPWMYFGELLREPPFPVSYPFVITALTVPAAIGVAMLGGVAQAGGRIVAAWRGRATSVSLPTEWLLLLNAIVPIVLIAWPTVPRFGGVKHWMPAMPFLALLGARALVTAGRLLSPARPALATSLLAALALAPAAWQVAHVHPFGTAAWNEIAGGAPGAASMGMQRQFWGDDLVAVLPELNAHAVPGARVWFQEATTLAVKQHQRDGRLRSDLLVASGPEDADVSIWQYHQEFRDREFRTWTEFRTARPVAGAYLDEVPLVQVYARPGAWR